MHNIVRTAAGHVVRKSVSALLRKTLGASVQSSVHNCAVKLSATPVDVAAATYLLATGRITKREFGWRVATAVITAVSVASAATIGAHVGGVVVPGAGAAVGAAVCGTAAGALAPLGVAWLRTTIESAHSESEATWHYAA